MLGALPAVAAFPAAAMPAGASPEAAAELAALIKRHAELHRELLADHRMAELDEADAIAQAVAAWPAATMADLAAKVRFSLTVLPRKLNGTDRDGCLLSDDTEHTLLRGILSDVLRLAETEEKDD